MTSNVVIKGVGGYLPDRVVSNDEVCSRLKLPASSTWIMKITGVKQRHIVSPDQTTADLACIAAGDALKDAGVLAEEVGIIVLSTTTPDHAFPAVAMRVQARLGAKNAVAFDVGAACSGFIVALDLAWSHMTRINTRYALVIGSEVTSRILDWSDRGTAVIFGDGAGAVLLERIEGSSDRGLLGSHFEADGTGYDDLYVEKTDAFPDGVIVMNGAEVFRCAVPRFVTAIQRVLEKVELTLADVDWIVPHQANQRIIDAVAQHGRIPQDKIVSVIDTHANTSSASIPLALMEAKRKGLFEEEDLIILPAFGAGFIWGALALRW